MQLTVSRKTFSDAFALAAAGVPGKTPKDVFKYVLLSAAETVSLRATDGEISIMATVPNAAATDPGMVLLPAARLQAILREIVGDTVTLRTEEKRLHITSESSEFRLDTADTADFPPPVKVDESAVRRISAAGLHRAMERTVIACDQESTRYALGGVLFDNKDDVLHLAATDSRRLAIMPAGGVGNLPGNEVIPARAINLLLRTIPDADVEVTIAFAPSGATFRTSQVLIAAQFVQGRFPDFRKVIPTPQKMASTVVGPFASAIRQAMIATGEETRGVTFRFDRGSLRLTSETASLGSAKIDLPISFDAGPVSIDFDPRYVLDFLKVLQQSDTVEVGLIDHESACLLSCGSYRYVIMPLAKDR